MLDLPVDLELRDMFDRLCAHMGLDPVHAVFGQKFEREVTCEPAHCLANDDDWQAGVETAIGLTT